MIDSVRKNPKTAKWEFDYKDLKGKRKTKKGFKTKAEAEKAQAQLIEELNKGICPADSKTSFKEEGELFMRLHVSILCKPSTEEG